MYSTDVRMIWSRKGVVSNCLHVLLLNHILLFLNPVILRIRILLLSVIIVKGDFACFRRGLRGRLGGRLGRRFMEDLSFLPLPPPLAPVFLGCALGLALDEGFAEVGVGVERPLPLVDCLG